MYRLTVIETLWGTIRSELELIEYAIAAATGVPPVFLFP